MENDKKRPAQLMGERLRKGDENPEVLNALYCLRQKRMEKMIEDEMKVQNSSDIYYF